MTIQFTSIGIIHTPHKVKEGMPIQSINAEGVRGTVKLKKQFVEGLLDLDGFSHIYLIYHFHKSTDYKLQVKPYLDDELHGVFSTRAPRRPNSIGISVVRLLGIKDNILEIENVDILDGTPLLDIKPYISGFDNHNTDKDGWIETKLGKHPNPKSDDRF